MPLKIQRFIAAKLAGNRFKSGMQSLFYIKSEGTMQLGETQGVDVYARSKSDRQISSTNGDTAQTVGGRQLD
jgi:hypothetical protein